MFVCERMAVWVKVDGKTVNKPGTPFEEAMIDLLLSDVPLDAFWRQKIAVLLEDLFFPLPKHQQKNRQKSVQNLLYKGAKVSLMRNSGWRAGDAATRAAAFVGKSVDAIEQQIKRGRRAQKTRRARRKRAK
jgi:hypothetical protein